MGGALADHRYYYLNAENDLYALIALQSDYTISDPMWREVDLSSETFKKMIGLVEGLPVYFNFRPYGSYILDHQKTGFSSIVLKKHCCNPLILSRAEKPYASF
jgi:hypothetical protein